MKDFGKSSANDQGKAGRGDEGVGGVVDRIRKRLRMLKTWRGRINFAIREGLTESEIVFLQNKAANWSCCAVGENRKALEAAGVKFYLDQEHGPSGEDALSSEAYHLGMRFMGAIFSKEYDEAAEILGQIETLKAG